jgi:hypothetical protein
MSKAFYDIKYWGRGWQQDAAMAYLTGNIESGKKILDKANREDGRSKGDESKVEFWLPKAPAAGASIPAKGKPEMGRLDPYMLTYSLSGIVPLAKFVAPGERLDRICLAIGEGSRHVNGAVDSWGWPYIRCFSSALNMQCGSIELGIYGGQRAGRTDLVAFYRDVARQNGMLGIYGRGQRTYSSAVRNPESSDLLYQCISDLHLRTAELNCDEDLWLHPAVYGTAWMSWPINATVPSISPSRAHGGAPTTSAARRTTIAGNAGTRRRSWVCSRMPATQRPPA